MSNRRVVALGRTDRPDAVAGVSTLPTVAEVLATPAVLGGLPEVVVGGAPLQAAVRWVHASDNADVARLLAGGELLLSTGAGWPADDGALTAFVASLADAGCVGLVLELGSRFERVPVSVVTTASARGLALIALHREVRFVSITEAVHVRIIDAQTAALVARDEVQAVFSALSLRGAPADVVVGRLSQVLRAVVVLETVAHEVVVGAIDGADLVDAADVFAGWERRSRAHAGTPGVEPDWLAVPVEARGTRWGRLVALPGPPHPAGRRAVLEQGALALAIGRLADADGGEWAALQHQRILDQLLEGRFASDRDAAARVEAAGLPLDAALVALAIGGVPLDAARAVDIARALLGAPTLAARRGDALALLVRTDSGDPLADRALVALGSALADAAGTSPSAVVVAAAEPADALARALAALERCLQLVRGRGRASGAGSRGRAGDAARGPVVLRGADRPLVQLVAGLREDPRVQAFAEQQLAPLLAHDAARGGDLIEVLRAVVAHPGNRTAAASASHLSRSVFYQRLALIADLTGADLDDGETLAALHLALLAHAG